MNCCRAVQVQPVTFLIVLTEACNERLERSLNNKEVIQNYTGTYSIDRVPELWQLDTRPSQQTEHSGCWNDLINHVTVLSPKLCCYWLSLSLPPAERSSIKNPIIHRPSVIEKREITSRAGTSRTVRQLELSF